ncbi:hypothetical protein ACFL59_05200 [Planctomycetota bacterium]
MSPSLGQRQLGGLLVTSAVEQHRRQPLQHARGPGLLVLGLACGRGQCGGRLADLRSQEHGGLFGNGRLVKEAVRLLHLALREREGESRRRGRDAENRLVGPRLDRPVAGDQRIVAPRFRSPLSRRPSSA